MKKYKDRFASITVIAIFFILVSLISWDNRTIYFEDQYKEAISKHYYLKKCDEYGWYELYDENGKLLGGSIGYGTPLLVADDAGKVTLYAGYLDTDAYIPIEVDEELKNDIIYAMGKAAWYVAPAGDYELLTDSVTGIDFLRKKISLLEESHVVLRSEEDMEKYRSLAKEYGAYFLPEDPDEMVDMGCTYANYEIMGLAHRFDEGFMFIQNNGILFTGSKEVKGWRLTLTYDEWHRLTHWIRQTKDPFSSPSYEYWKGIFEELDIEYDPDMDPDSPRYRAAREWLIKTISRYSKEDISEEQLKNTMKEFDEEGYRLGIFGVAGMDSTDRDPKEWHRLIDIPAEYRNRLFDYEKDRLVDSYGLSWDDSKRSVIYRDCQLATDKQKRLSCAWTMGQYDRMYEAALLSVIKREAPDWELGDTFDTSILSEITREEVEESITTKDGINLQMTLSPEVRAILQNSRRDMAIPMMY